MSAQAAPALFFGLRAIRLGPDNMPVGPFSTCGY